MSAAAQVLTPRTADQAVEIATRERGYVVAGFAVSGRVVRIGEQLDQIGGGFLQKAGVLVVTEETQRADWIQQWELFTGATPKQPKEGYRYFRCVHRLKPCQFCTDESAGSCCWPDKKFVTLKYDELLHGDKVRRAHGTRSNQPPATVTEIEAVSLSRLKFTLSIQGKKAARTKEIEVYGFSAVQALRDAICGNPVCELHMRSVGESKAYCREHWDSWSQVA